MAQGDGGELDTGQILAHRLEVVVDAGPVVHRRRPICFLVRRKEIDVSGKPAGWSVAPQLVNCAPAGNSDQVGLNANNALSSCCFLM